MKVEKKNGTCIRHNVDPGSGVCDIIGDVTKTNTRVQESNTLHKGPFDPSNKKRSKSCILANSMGIVRQFLKCRSLDREHISTKKIKPLPNFFIERITNRQKDRDRSIS